MHIGDKIKARAKELRIGPTELARKIKSSKQNVYGIYQRDTLDTGLLQKLSKALDFDFFAYYTTTSGNSVSSPRGTYKKGKKSGPDPEEEIAALQHELDELREKYELLKSLFEVRTGKKVPGSLD
jgi:hypothetical protein